VRDKAEVSLPKIGLIEFEDAETGRIMAVDTSSRKFRQQYESKNTRRFEELKGTLRSINVDCISISTDRQYIQDLIGFFRMRHRRF